MELEILVLPALPALIFSFLFAFHVRSILRGRVWAGGPTYPPGPPGIPVLGNLFNMPKIQPWVAYRELSRKYGKQVFILCTCVPHVR